MGLFGQQPNGTSGGQIPSDPSTLNMLGGRDPWDLNFPLFSWSPVDHYTLRNSFEALAIFGELGAAKSTGSAALALTRYMSIGMGGLVCCVKPGDRELVEQYARLTGRSDSLIVVSPKNHWRCNLMRYLQRKPGIRGSRVESLVSLLMTIVESTERSERGKTQGGDIFWPRAVRQLLRNGIEVGIAAYGEVSMRQLHDILSSAPRNPAEVHNPEWQKGSACYQAIEAAEEKASGRSEREQRDYEQAATYLLREWPGLPPETGGSVYATYNAMADVLRRGTMADLFDGETNFIPELTFEGAIIVLDLPTKIYGQSGVNVQAAFTYLWQMACEQRDVKANPRPVFWFVDEAQELFSDYWPVFLATARSARVASVLISQNKPNYLAAMGGEAGRHRVDAFLGNIGTKVFHSNGDVETNRWASETINDAVQTRMNFHSNRDGQGHGSGGGGESVGRKVLPSEFTQLKKGGEQNGFITETIVYQTGASFAANENEPFLRARFKQIIPGVTVKR